MTTFTVSYDLIKTKDYPELWAELGRLGGHRTQDSYWLVNVDATAREFLVHLKQFVDSDDTLWISELTRNHTFTKAKGGTIEWIAANPPSR